MSDTEIKKAKVSPIDYMMEKAKHPKGKKVTDEALLYAHQLIEKNILSKVSDDVDATKELITRMKDVFEEDIEEDIESLKGTFRRRKEDRQKCHVLTKFVNLLLSKAADCTPSHDEVYILPSDIESAVCGDEKMSEVFPDSDVTFEICHVTENTDDDGETCSEKVTSEMVMKGTEFMGLVVGAGFFKHKKSYVYVSGRRLATKVHHKEYLARYTTKNKTSGYSSFTINDKPTTFWVRGEDGRKFYSGVNKGLVLCGVENVCKSVSWIDGEGYPCDMQA